MMIPPFGYGLGGSSFDQYSSKEEIEAAKRRSIKNSKRKVENLTRRLLDTINATRVSEGEKVRMRQQVIEAIAQ